MAEKRLIDANALMKKSRRMYTEDEIDSIAPIATNCVTVDDIHRAPTIDAVEVVHGKWENVTVEAYFVPTIEEKTKRDFPCCSRCHQIQSIAAWTKPFNYCPNCGAKMDAKDMDVPTKDGGAE